MLKDPRSLALTENFAGQWLNLRGLQVTSPLPLIYPDFDDPLRQAMVQETEMFFEDVLKHERSLLNFVDSDYSFLNERLATHYEIEGVKGPEMRRVSLPPGSHRGGVMTMAGVLWLLYDTCDWLAPFLPGDPAHTVELLQVSRTVALALCGLAGWLLRAALDPSPPPAHHRAF